MHSEKGYSKEAHTQISVCKVTIILPFYRSRNTHKAFSVSTFSFFLNIQFARIVIPLKSYIRFLCGVHIIFCTYRSKLTAQRLRIDADADKSSVYLAVLQITPLSSNTRKYWTTSSGMQKSNRSKSAAAKLKMEHNYFCEI